MSLFYNFFIAYNPEVTYKMDILCFSKKYFQWSSKKIKLQLMISLWEIYTLQHNIQYGYHVKRGANIKYFHENIFNLLTIIVMSNDIIIWYKLLQNQFEF